MLDRHLFLGCWNPGEMAHNAAEQGSKSSWHHGSRPLKNWERISIFRSTHYWCGTCCAFSATAATIPLD